ncbi:hypothetical protein JCM10212_005405 [Sporobolomyces blumeae]
MRVERLSTSGTGHHTALSRMAKRAEFDRLELPFNASAGSDSDSSFVHIRADVNGASGTARPENYNEATALYFNFVVGAVVLVAFFIALPSWARLLRSRRGRSRGWLLDGGRTREYVDAVIDDDDEDGPSFEKSGKVGDARVIMVGDVRCQRPSIEPVGLLTARIRTLRTRFLLRSFPLPFSLFSHLTLAQLLACLAYEGLVVLALFHRCPDQATNWKRSGYVAVAQMPAVWTAAAKNGVGFLLGHSYEKLNFLHRVAGRLLMLCALLHALLFLEHASWALRWESEVQKTGMIAVIALSANFVSSVEPVRRAFYQLFLVSHVLGFVTFLVALHFHVPDASRPYVLTCVFLNGTDLVCRILRTRVSKISLAHLSSNATMAQSHRFNRGWVPGQHVLVRVWTWTNWFENHPFTVANAGSDDSSNGAQSHKLTLLAKTTGSFTRALYARARDPNRCSTLLCTIEGPYGSPLGLDFHRFQSVLLFAGGSGITFCVSVLKGIVAGAIRNDRGSRTRDVTLVWDVECVEWYQSMLTSLVVLAETRSSLNLSIFLHVTSQSALPSSSSIPSPIPTSSLVSSRPNPSTYVTHSISSVLYSLTSPCSFSPFPIEKRLVLGSASGGQRRLIPIPGGGGLGVAVCGGIEFASGVREAVASVPAADSIKA